MEIKKSKALNGEVIIPGDKSISHRSIMLGGISEGITEVHHFLQGADCLSSIDCFRKMGIRIENHHDIVRIHGRGLRGLKQPESVLDTGNSGTTTRLISGLLAAQNFESILNGDESIQKRPMTRIITPLSRMGAQIESLNHNGCTPLHIKGGALKGINYNSPVASAQVKSAILLAGLYADKATSVTEPYLSRNHTELMMKSFGVNLESNHTTTTVYPVNQLSAQKIIVPGDISSAAYFIAAALIVPNSHLFIKNVGINPTRSGLLDVCRDMGADIALENIRDKESEPVADIIVKSSSLQGTVIEGAIIPRLIDELPVIAILACFANGQTVIKDAKELKVKETNRIDTVSENLSLMGVNVTPTEDGMIIQGGSPLHGAVIDSKADHRIAMSFSVAALNCEGMTTIKGSECIDISYPTFFMDLAKLTK